MAALHRSVQCGVFIGDAMDKRLKKILFMCSLVIFLFSVELMLNVKSAEMYDAFNRLNPGKSLSDFFLSNVILYFFSIFDLVIMAVYSVLAIKRFGVTKLMKAVFTALLTANLVHLIFRFNYISIFYYIIIVTYVVFIVLVLRMETGGGE